MTKKQKYLSSKISKLHKEHPEWEQSKIVAVAYSYADKKFQDGGAIYPQQYPQPQTYNSFPNGVYQYLQQQPNFNPNLQYQGGFNLGVFPQSATNDYKQEQLNLATEYQNTNYPLDPSQIQDTTPQTQENVTVQNKMLNPYTGVSNETALFRLGQSLGYKGDNKTANTLRGITAGGKFLLSGARTLFSGMGYENMNENQQKDFMNRLYNTAPQATFLQDGGQVTNGQMMTGAYITDSLNPNVEIEKDEYTLNSESGAVQKAVGDTHEQGGIPTNLPQGSMVLSDHLTIGAKKAKYFRKEFDINVKAKDTYADVMDKYNTKIGLKKLLKEEEALITKIEKVDNMPEDNTATSDINMQFLSDKMKEINMQKEQLKSVQQKAFTTIYDEQEETKPNSKMQNGGMVGELAAKYNIDPQRAAELIKFQNGGETPYNFYNTNPYRLNEYANQPYGSTSYIAGNVTTPEEAQARIQQNMQLYPYLLQSSGLSENITPDTIGQFQRKYNDFTSATLAALEDNPYLNEEQKQQFKDQALNESFSTGVRGFDSTLGNFTISRGGFSLPYLTAEEKAQYPELRNIGDIVDENNNIKDKYKNLSNAKLIQDTVQKAGVDARNMGLLEIQQAQPQAQAAQQQTVNKTVTEYSLPNVPQDFILPPSPASSVYKPDVTLSRIDPTKISPEANLIEANRQMQAAFDATQGLPESQRAAAISSILGQTQATTNQAISAAEQTNAQELARVQQYNAQQSDKQQLLNEQFAKSYEAQQFAAQTNTRRDLQQYFQDLNTQQRFNFNYIDRRQAFNEAPMNYKIGQNGIVFDSNGNMILQATPENLQRLARTPQEEALYKKSQLTAKGKKDGSK